MTLSKTLPLILVLIVLAIGVTYLKKSEVTEVTDEIQSGQAAPHRSEIPF